MILGSGGAHPGRSSPHGLIDAMLLTIHPLVLGSGRAPVPRRRCAARFRLVESKPTTTGVLIMRYEAA